MSRQFEGSEVKCWLVFELPGRPFSRTISQVVAIETELVATKVKGEHGVGLRNSCKIEGHMM